MFHLKLGIIQQFTTSIFVNVVATRSMFFPHRPHVLEKLLSCPSSQRPIATEPRRKKLRSSKSWKIQRNKLLVTIGVNFTAVEAQKKYVVWRLRLRLPLLYDHLWQEMDTEIRIWIKTFAWSLKGASQFQIFTPSRWPVQTEPAIIVVPPSKQFLLPKSEIWNSYLWTACVNKLRTARVSPIYQFFHPQLNI